MQMTSVGGVFDFFGGGFPNATFHKRWIGQDSAIGEYSGWRFKCIESIRHI